MKDRTVSQRIKRQRADRIREGWEEVRVWVPSRQDAEDIRKLAAERRSLAEAQFHTLAQKEYAMNLEANIADAIDQQDSPDYITPSGAMLTLMTKLAEEGELMGFSRAFLAFARAQPRNASLVQSSAPAKILNGYFFKHRDLKNGAYERWERANPAWGDTIIAALREPERFAQVVSEMADDFQKAAA
jgi:predicted membrane chloride channel (bestrophin family)